MFAKQGNWKGLLNVRRKAIEELSTAQIQTGLCAEIEGHWCVALTWAGRYAETEQYTRPWLKVLKEMGEEDYSGAIRDLGFALGMQGKFDDAYMCFAAASENTARVLSVGDASSHAFWGAILLREGKLRDAQSHLDLFWQYATKYDWINDYAYYCWFGELDELKLDWTGAALAYRKCLDNNMIVGRSYFGCRALIGLVRVKHAQGDHTAIPPLLVEAEPLAQKYEYHDHLASIRLIQGHIVWESTPDAQHSIIGFYQHALIYALRYNRFLLDEVLSGRPQGTPLRPIIPFCLKRGGAGRQILSALCAWWKTGVNSVGTSRPDTISPLTEDSLLLDAERIAREREPGDGTPQRTVVEQLETALAAQQGDDMAILRRLLDI